MKLGAQKPEFIVIQDNSRASAKARKYLCHSAVKRTRYLIRGRSFCLRERHSGKLGAVAPTSRAST
jgi:hypothetical protein